MNTLRFSAVKGLPCLLLLASCDPFHTEFDDVEPAETYQAGSVKKAAKKSALTVMTYNVKFGGGRIDFFFDCHGDRVLMKKSEVLANLSALAKVIESIDPDVLFLQEVDVASKRAAYVDQLQWLLDHTSLNYAVYAPQWRADYVPSDGIGAVDSGNAIASKYPISDGTRLALPLRTDQDGLERYFYLRRNILRAEIDVGVPLFAVATHTSAYSQDGTKLLQIERFKEELDSLREQGVVLGGGDLNALPPGSEKTSDFEDSMCTDEAFQADDYGEEKAWLEPLYGDYAEAIPLEEYQQDNSRYFTHTTDGKGFWNRRLDYLFSNASFAEGSGVVHQDKNRGGFNTMPLSDHAPLSATLELP